MATVETLEGRTLLSNVVTSFTHDAITGANTLNITGDTHDDTFSVTENYSNGFVTLVGTGSPVKTQGSSGVPGGWCWVVRRKLLFSNDLWRKAGHSVYRTQVTEIK
jgi:hypothetical protein